MSTPDDGLRHNPVTTGALPFELMFGTVTTTVTPVICAWPVAVIPSAVVLAFAPPPAVIAYVKFCEAVMSTIPPAPEGQMGTPLAFWFS